MITSGAPLIYAFYKNRTQQSQATQGRGKEQTRRYQKHSRCIVLKAKTLGVARVGVRATDGASFSTPANWLPGGDVIVSLALNNEQATEKFGALGSASITNGACAAPKYAGPPLGCIFGRATYAGTLPRGPSLRLTTDPTHGRWLFGDRFGLNPACGKYPVRM